MWLFGVAVVLLSAGVVMVYSASAIVAADRFHDPYFFLKKQRFWAVLGAACLWGALRLDHRRLEGLVLPLLIFAGGAVPAPPHLCVHRPVVGSAGQRVPDHPVVAGVRQRRARGPGHRGLAA